MCGNASVEVRQISDDVECIAAPCILLSTQVLRDPDSLIPRNAQRGARPGFGTAQKLSRKTQHGHGAKPAASARVPRMTRGVTASPLFLRRVPVDSEGAAPCPVSVVGSVASSSHSYAGVELKADGSCSVDCIPHTLMRNEHPETHDPAAVNAPNPQAFGHVSGPR